MRLFIFLLLSWFYAAAPALAADDLPLPALTSHGEPKLAAPFTAFPYVNPTAPKGGSLRIALTGTFDSLNPFILKGNYPPATYYNVFVFESLLYRSADEPFTLYPWLAEKVAMAADRSSITFILNPKARWQDGVPVTAADLIFTWKTLAKDGRPNMRSYYARVADVKAIDDRTVRFFLKAKDDKTYDRELPLLIGLMPVLPEHALKGKDFSQTTLSPMLGSGAYKITRVDPGRKIEMEHVKDYWAADLPTLKGQQNFDRITLDFYRDEMVARQAVLSGAADFKGEADLLKWQKFYKGRAVDNGDVVLEALPHHRPEPYRGFVLNTRRAPFDQPALRRALRLAADFDQINQTLYGGAYKRSLSSFANSTLAAVAPEGAGESAEAARANLKMARDQLLQAGFSYQDEKLLSPDKKPVTFEILLNDANDERIALAYRRQLERLGITARVRTVDSAQFQARLNDFDFDLMVYRWVNSLSPGNEQAIYWGSAAADVKGSRNYAGVRDQGIDKAISQILTATDQDQLVDAAQSLDAQLIAGNYVIPFFYSGADLFVRRKNIHRPQQLPLTGYDIRTFWSE